MDDKILLIQFLQQFLDKLQNNKLSKQDENALKNFYLNYTFDLNKDNPSNLIFLGYIISSLINE